MSCYRNCDACNRDLRKSIGGCCTRGQPSPPPSPPDACNPMRCRLKVGKEEEEERKDGGGLLPPPPNCVQQTKKRLWALDPVADCCAEEGRKKVERHQRPCGFSAPPPQKKTRPLSSEMSETPFRGKSLRQPENNGGAEFPVHWWREQKLLCPLKGVGNEDRDNVSKPVLDKFSGHMGHFPKLNSSFLSERSDGGVLDHRNTNVFPTHFSVTTDL